MSRIQEEGVSYREFADVYDELMDTVPYEEWAEIIRELIGRYGVSKPEHNAPDPLESERNLVLDLGCGTGTLTELLYAMGFDCIGIDSSESMLMKALEKKADSGSDIMYFLQDMRELDLYCTVGTVVSVCDSINYILDPSELRQVFSLVNNFLFPGGIFLFDFNTAYKYREVIGDTVIAENREDCSFIWENDFDEQERINRYDLTLFLQREGGLFEKVTETHFQRGYEPEEIRALLTDAGMEVVLMRDSETCQEVTCQSQRVLVVAREQGKEKIDG